MDQICVESFNIRPIIQPIRPIIQLKDKIII